MLVRNVAPLYRKPLSELQAKLPTTGLCRRFYLHVIACGTPSRAYSTSFAREKIAVFAPIASASDPTAIAVNPGLWRRIHIAYRRSAHNSSHIAAQVKREFHPCRSPPRQTPPAPAASLLVHPAHPHQIRRTCLQMELHLLLHILLQPQPPHHRTQPRPTPRSRYSAGYKDPCWITSR